MKNRKTTHFLGAALLAAAACLAQTAYAAEGAAPTSAGPVQTAVATLPTTARADIKAVVISADRPSLLLVCSSNPAKPSCAANESALAAQAAAHPEVKVVKILSEENGIPTGLYTYVPGSGLSFQQPDFDAAKADDGFYARRVELALKEAAAVKEFQAVAAKIKGATKPADEKLAALEDEDGKQFEAMSAKINEVYAAQAADPAVVKLTEKRAAQAAPYDKRIAALRQQIQRLSVKKSKATAATEKQLTAAKVAYRDRRYAIQAAYDEQQSALSPKLAAARKEQKAAAEPFAKELAAVRAALQALLEADQPAN